VTAIADTSLIDGPARTIVLVIGGLACAGLALAWLLCRAAAIADRVEPGCDEMAWLDYCDRCDGRHVFTRQGGVCCCCLICTAEVYDNVAVEALHADLAAFERGER